MQDQIQIALDVDEVGDIVLDKVKIGIAEQVLDIDHTACKQVVHADHPIPFIEKPVTEVGAEKPGSTGYEYTSVSGHVGKVMSGLASPGGSQALTTGRPTLIYFRPFSAILSRS